MKKKFLKPTITVDIVWSSLPLAASGPELYHGELGSRPLHWWDEDGEKFVDEQENDNDFWNGN